MWHSRFQDITNNGHTFYIGQVMDIHSEEEGVVSFLNGSKLKVATVSRYKRQTTIQICVPFRRSASDDKRSLMDCPRYEHNEEEI